MLSFLQFSFHSLFQRLILALLLSSGLSCVGLCQDTPAMPSKLIALSAIDPTFDAQVEHSYPGLTHREQYEAVRPFLVLLTSNSALTAKAYAISWQVDTSGGARHHLSTFFVRSHFAVPSADHSIRPGDIRLVSPVFNLSPSEYAQHPDFEGQYPSTMYPHFSSSMIVQSALDGVVYSDGTFAGPNQTQILQLYRCYRNAEHDEALAILEMTASHTSPASINESLNKDVLRGYSAQGKDVQAMYHNARAESADLMRLTLKRVGPDTFDQRLRRLIESGPSNNYSHMAAWF